MNKLRNILVYLTCYTVSAEDIDDLLDMLIAMLYAMREASPEERVNMANLATVMLGGLAQITLSYMAIGDKVMQITGGKSILSEETMDKLDYACEESRLAKKLRL
mgnify:CR=1 FL=1|tara:strand:- start:1165 stop:1479 length:315 start_codon:yes stop_codon:yes gene_type:complete